ncbi:SMI1/KNR4 family protein [Paenibacillus sp. HWE-109]|uniref:SMI1/KNR4 family protein n=1 Tax=Paenibacillus sp. HWE-109 TaxID=1306526 RepID=UPI001EE0778F|nr:SMI1/KNR4 family protein [Paenibacillus sp. HWE-109]UKS27872.1 SMI1/KNR4 family protein [Paenibacillus sp. HWE-109]
MNNKLIDNLELLTEAYARTDRTPESEEAILAFEEKYDCRVPPNYRWLLLHFGSCHFLDPWIDSIHDLDWAYPSFVENYKEYERAYELAPRRLFPVGGMGDGSTVVEDLETGQLLILLHDSAEDDPFEELAGSFDELILEQISMVNRIEELK